MKIINNPKVFVTVEDVEKLLIRYIEKKTGKKVASVEFPEVSTAHRDATAVILSLSSEEQNVEEPKNG
jgi:hypothetical protein